MDIRDVVHSSDPKIAEIGTKAVQLTNALEQGIVTQTEYKELAEDLVDIRRIEKLASSVKHKAFLAEVFEVVSTFLTFKGTI